MNAPTSQDADLQRALLAVWSRRRPAVFERLATVERALSDALEGTITDEARTEAERAAHQIAGSAGTFGFEEASVHARAIEHALRDGSPPLADLPRLAGLVQQVRQELEREDVLADDAEQEEEDDDAPADVLLVVPDADRARRLADALIPRGLHPAAVDTVAAARTALERPGLTAVLLELDGPEGPDAALSLLEEIADDLPVLACDPAGTVDRDEITRRRGHGPLAAGLDVVQTAAALAALRHRTFLLDTSVAVVAQDEAAGRTLRVALADLGVDVATDPGADDIRVVLARTRPELLVLAPAPGRAPDALLACRTVRNDPRWSTLPVVVVARDGAPSSTAAFAAGADDYLDDLAAAGDELEVRVRNRIERVRSRATDADRLEPETALPSLAAPVREPTVDVVVVEDDPSIVALLEHALDGRGLTVRHYGDGLQAATALAANPPTTIGRVVLMDWDLPGIDGLRVLRSMADNGSLEQSRVIMLTARAGEREILQALEAGATDHVAKPFSLPVLLQRIRAAMLR